MSEKRNTEVQDFDIQSRIEIATQALDRNMGLVSNCDNKASIILALFGVLLGFAVSDNGLETIKNIVSEARGSETVFGALYLLCLGLSAAVIVVGICCIAYVLVARGTNKGQKKDSEEYSQLFFREIANKGSFTRFSESFGAMTKEDVLKAVLNDIYENALIAKKKYKYYNIGLVLSAIGSLIFAVLLMVGMLVH